MEDHKEKLADLEKKFLLFEQKLLSGIDNIQDNQKEAVAAIVDIKEAIFDPDKVITFIQESIASLLAYITLW